MKGRDKCSVVNCEKTVAAAVETAMGEYKVCLTHAREASEGKPLVIDMDADHAPPQPLPERPAISGAKVIRTTHKSLGEYESITPKNGTDFTGDEIHAIVGGYFEIVRLDSRNIMLVDEEGLLKGKPVNTGASLISGQNIVGDVLVCPMDMVR